MCRACLGASQYLPIYFFFFFGGGGVSSLLSFVVEYAPNPLLILRAPTLLFRVQGWQWGCEPRSSVSVMERVGKPPKLAGLIL